MSFRETLGRHLLAIETRDLDTLAATLADPLLLVMADGQLKRTKREFVDAHRGWFERKNWTLSAKPVEIYEAASLGVAVLHLDYRENGNRSESYLTLVLEKRGGGWLMVQDQNTPVQARDC
ncbi:MAG TPA: nuclear transport factor 2 family protein [Burkholderiales bacterium]|nr:nuclear transport factor 2 family protein [Burkholderiales bacterium]